MKNINVQKNNVMAFIAGLVLMGGVYFAIDNSSKPSNSTASPTTFASTNTPLDEAVTIEPEEINTESVASNETNQNKLLLFLIEEEKLAHDVYTVLYEKYGARVFGNILKSESTHQDRVLSLLHTRNLSDPRTGVVGTFTDQNLQTLYNNLIEQGMKSAEEAYKVGVAIEEKDIADITTQLATATDSDIVTTLEALRNGSENHLRAFNRQLSKY